MKKYKIKITDQIKIREIKKDYLDEVIKEIKEKIEEIELGNITIEVFNEEKETKILQIEYNQNGLNNYYMTIEEYRKIIREQNKELKK